MNSADILANCVCSLRSSMQLAESSINIIESGVHDFPRLTTVLQTTKHFELVSEAELKEAQSSLVSEIGPEIETLLSHVDEHLDALARTEKSLVSKCELQEGRIARQDERRRRSASASAPGSASRSASASRAARAKSPALTGLGSAAATASRLEEVKMMQLRRKKERLSYAVERLELQASQRQRQLRKSMAP